MWLFSNIDDRGHEPSRYLRYVIGTRGLSGIPDASGTNTSGPLLNLSLNLSAIFEMAIRIEKIFLFQTESLKFPYMEIF